MDLLSLNLRSFKIEDEPDAIGLDACSAFVSAVVIGGMAEERKMMVVVKTKNTRFRRCSDVESHHQ